MQSIDENRLESDVGYRFGYLADFIGFGPSDAAAIQSLAPYLGPQIPEIVERTYARLLAYDATARHFVPRQSGFEGATPTNLKEVTSQHPQVQFRKEHLARYFMHLFSRECNQTLAPFLDMAGKIHTPKAGNSKIDVPLVQMNALMGHLSDLLFEMVLALPLGQSEKISAIRSLNKLMWIQNDFIVRHYESK